MKQEIFKPSLSQALRLSVLSSTVFRTTSFAFILPDFSCSVSTERLEGWIAKLLESSKHLQPFPKSKKDVARGNFLGPPGNLRISI